MKQIKRAILPVLTVVIVLGAVVLPGQLSKWKDQALMNRVHQEESITNMKLPNYTLSMEERLKLFVRNQDSPDGIAVMTQTLLEDELNDAEEMMRRELNVYVENGFLEENVYEEIIQSTLPRGEQRYGSRLFLQDEQTRATTRVIICEEVSKYSDLHLWVNMDEETGRILAFEFTIPATQLQQKTRAFAEFFMSRLGVPYECSWESEGGYAVEMTIPGQNVTYHFDFGGNFNSGDSEWGYVSCRPYSSDSSQGEPQADGEYVATY